MPLTDVQGGNAVGDDNDDIGEDEINILPGLADGSWLNVRIKLALRCGGKVFDAERIAMDFGHYHKKCFSCAECTRVSLCAFQIISQLNKFLSKV